MSSPVIVALDFSTAKSTLEFTKTLDPKLCRVKVGKELFTCEGPSIVEKLQNQGFEVFLDLKFHDIPNTTAQAVLSAARLGVWMTNIHAMAGNVTMQTCLERIHDLPTKLIAVTILTSMDEPQLRSIGVQKSIPDMVKDLTQLSYDNGLHGVVCSAQEASMLRQHLAKDEKNDFLLVTPGIRMTSDDTNDQKRVCTPKQAMENGSSYLVIGRSITRAERPQLALERILDSLK